MILNQNDLGERQELVQSSVVKLGNLQRSLELPSENIKGQTVLHKIFWLLVNFLIV